ncbi:MAG: hypothetical protein HOO87_08990 [Methyloglobulus sp.]|nr:hypothetical protein [Methyloglobulus sp.]
MSRLQENGRFAMQTLSRDIRKADYRACPSMPRILQGNGSGGISGVNAEKAPTKPMAADTITVNWQEDIDLCGPTAAVPKNAFYGIEKSSDGQLFLMQGITQLVEGVENLQIVYGVDTNSDFVPDYYSPAFATVADAKWAQVVSVRVSLLLRTLDDNIASEPLPYTFNGVTGTDTYDPITGLVNNPATDRRIRRVFTTTIALRNRLK